MQTQNLSKWKQFLKTPHHEDDCEHHNHEIPDYLFEEMKESLIKLSENEFMDIESQYNRILLKQGVLLNEAVYIDIETSTNPVIRGRGQPSPTNQDPYSQEIKNPERPPRIRLIYARPDQGIWKFRVPGCRSQAEEECPTNSRDHYITSIRGLKRGNIKDLRKADVEVSCTCPYFRWSGPEYNAKVGKYQYKSPIGTASTPNIRDPQRINKVCKHVIAVFGILKKFPFFMEYK